MGFSRDASREEVKIRKKASLRNGVLYNGFLAMTFLQWLGCNGFVAMVFGSPVYLSLQTKPPLFRKWAIPENIRLSLKTSKPIKIQH